MATSNRDGLPANLSPETGEALDERATLEQELELAHARREMRRALVAKLVEEYRTNPMQIRKSSLRDALVERDIVEEQCDLLERALKEALGAAKIVRLRPRNGAD